MEQFMKEIETYLRLREMSASAFGREAVGDPMFVFALRGGRECLPRTVRKVREYMHKVPAA